jgi:hypothetical protein
MLNSGQFEVRVDKVHRRYIFCSGVVYVLGFLLSVIIGVTGPSVWKASNGDSTNDCPTHDCALDVFGRMDNATWTGELTSMGAEHQLLYLEGSIAKPSFNADEDATRDMGISYTLEVIVNAIGTTSDGVEEVIVENQRHMRSIICYPHDKYCQNITIFSQSYIHYEKYALAVTFIHPEEKFDCNDERRKLGAYFTMRYVNKDFTKFEMLIKYLYLGITVLIALCPRVGFFVRLWKVRRQFWSYEQRWVATLLVALFFFNGPFQAAEIYSAVFFWSAFYIISVATFVSLIMLFWLCMLHLIGSSDYRVGGGGRKRGLVSGPIKSFVRSLFAVLTCAVHPLPVLLCPQGLPRDLHLVHDHHSVPIREDPAATGPCIQFGGRHGALQGLQSLRHPPERGVSPVDWLLHARFCG